MTSDPTERPSFTSTCGLPASAGDTLTRPLAVRSPLLHALLTCGAATPEKYRAEEIQRETLWISMRDGVRLATDLYLPPCGAAPAVAMRTPYGRALHSTTFMYFARRGYVVVAQDCRGTGDSEPDTWDFLIYEREDGYDFVEWVSRQSWFCGFLGGCGGSYVAATQVGMAMHPRMSAIAPEVGGIVYAPRTARFYNFVNSYSKCVGKGKDKLPVSYEEMERRMVEETLAGGYFNDPLRVPIREEILKQYPELRSLPLEPAKRQLWELYSELPPAGRVELIRRATGEDHITFASMEPLSDVFGRHLSHGLPSAHTPGVLDLARSLRAPTLLIGGWYDWGLAHTLASWDFLTRTSTSSGNRLLIAPSAHGMPGYHEGRESHPELERTYRTPDIQDVLLHWYASVRAQDLAAWPHVIYYLMGANEWYAASAWPPPEAAARALYLGTRGCLTEQAPSDPSDPDQYLYDPENPTPTVGGSLVSFVYPPGSVDVSVVQTRADVLNFTTEPLAADLDVVGPLKLILYASSSAVDTDFVARVSDVFPDGRAIQLQSGILRARYRDLLGEPQHLEPGRVYRLEIDLQATANRFRAGHRLRLDISSADFPKYDRNTNLGGEPGTPTRALQKIYRDPLHPSHLIFSVMPGHSAPGALVRT